MKNGLIAAALAAVLAFAVAPQPAFAADEATLTCVMTTLEPAGRTLIENSVHNLFTQQGDVGTSAEKAAIKRASTACAKQFGWSASATQYAENYARAMLAVPIAAGELRTLKIDPDRVTALYREIPLEVRQRQGALDTSMPPEFETMFGKAISEGLITDEKNGRSFGLFVGMLYGVDSSRSGFLAS